jgi:hypothetical protein
MQVQHRYRAVVVNVPSYQRLAHVLCLRIAGRTFYDILMLSAPEHFAAMILGGLIKDRQRNWHWRYCDSSGVRLNKGSGQGFNCGHGVFLSNFRLGQSIAEIHHR